MKRIIVIGGGIGGLVAAHRICELNRERSGGIEVLLFEGSARLGGAIATERVDDFLMEGGPDSFITEKSAALRLCERLGLTSRLVSTQAAYQKIYVVHRGKLEALPEGFFLLAPTRMWPFLRTPLFSWGGKLRMAAELVLPRRNSDGDESLGAFVRRRFGQEALERVAQPLVGGIYASDPDQLSLRATMPRFQEMEKRCRSLTWTMYAEQRRRARQRESGSGARWSLFVTLVNGMQELVETIAMRLPERSVRLNSPALHLKLNGAKWRVVFNDGSEANADGVILATPAFQSAKLVRSVLGEAATALEQIPYASTATVSLGYRRSDFLKQPDSFGFVVPLIEQRKIMACTFSSLKYPGRAPAGYILLRAFVGGALQPELFDVDDSSMLNNVRTELADLLGVTAEPLFTRIWRHPNSMPQYHVGHPAHVARIEDALSRFPSLALAGSAYHGVGIADCIRTGELAAERVADSLAPDSLGISRSRSS